MLGDLHPACFVQWHFDRAASAETNIGLCTHTASRIRNSATGRLRTLSAHSSTMMRSRSRGARTRWLSITLGPTLLRCCHACRVCPVAVFSAMDNFEQTRLLIEVAVDWCPYIVLQDLQEGTDVLNVRTCPMHGSRERLTTRTSNLRHFHIAALLPMFDGGVGNEGSF